VFDLYAERSPAVYKVAVMLEECALAYRLKHVSVSHGQQHEPEFKALSPNGKIPVLVDDCPQDQRGPLVIFDSGAILIYLAEKVRQFLPEEPRQRAAVLQWHLWQATGLSPMTGQAIHFIRYAPLKDQAYGTLRYKTEVRRLYGVLQEQLQHADYLCGEYSVADIGTYPWVLMHDRLDMALDEFPAVARWFERVGARAAVSRAYRRMNAELAPIPPPGPQLLRSLFGDNAQLLTVPTGNFVPKDAPRD
jgi:GSH-dependent disulfide-bond oxidoreductase